MRERVVRKGVDRSRVVVVRDGATVPPKVASADHQLAREIRCGFAFVVLHAGNLGFYGAWDTLVEASRRLDGDGIGFVLVGDGAARSHIETLADGCPQVRFLPFRPPEEVPYVLAAADIHVVTIRRGLEGVVVPSKLYPILAAGRPVLALAPESSDVARIVRHSGCGVVVDPDDPASTAGILRELANDRLRLQKMAERARVAARKYDQKTQLNRLTRILEHLP